MAIERDATLRKAEKFLRQGRLEQAIGEYLRVIKEQPRDWSTINTVGDLFVRAGQIESAIEQYTRIGDHFFEEGFLPKAAAVYKKILKLKPEAEKALLRSAEIAERQGLLAETKAALGNVADLRTRKGDRKGAAEIHLRLAALDPSDLTAGLTAARASAELGDAAAAVQRLVQLSGELQQRGRLPESLQALDEAVRIDPGNTDVRSALVTRCIEGGELGRAADYATSATEFKAIAAEWSSRGDADQVLGALEHALDSDPEDGETRRQIVRSHLAHGDLERARGYLSGEITDPELLLSLAEIELRSGRLDQGRELAARVLLRDPTRREELVLLGCRLCEYDPEGAFQCIDVATDAAVADSDWPAAASALHEYATRVSGHIPALMKLVEVCVDGGLEATMYTAQAQLADAYLKADRGNEARVIAEDLVAREPWEPANIERFRRALMMLGEPDPDSVIADRLSGDSPFTSTDFTLDFNLDEPATPPAEAAPGKEKPGGDVYELGPGAIDLTKILGEDTKPAGGGADDMFEIDLSGAVGDGPSPTAAAEGGGRGAEAPEDLERVFESFREKSVRAAGGAAGEQYRLALGYRDAGDTEAAIRALEQVVRSPRYRFEAAATLARIHRDAGHVNESLEWFERAAEAAPAGTEATRQLLYDLGKLLVDIGENARALAVFMELQADSPDYRDVSAQVERLSPKA